MLNHHVACSGYMPDLNLKGADVYVFYLVDIKELNPSGRNVSFHVVLQSKALTETIVLSGHPAAKKQSPFRVKPMLLVILIWSWPCNKSFAWFKGGRRI